MEELEAHLRDQIADLNAAGLAADEAFLIAVKRMGELDDLSREFAREHSGRLWRQLVLSGGEEEQAAAEPVARGARCSPSRRPSRSRSHAWSPGFPSEEPSWLFRNASLLVIPFLAGWFARRRRLPLRDWLLTAARVRGRGRRHQRLPV